MEKTKKAVKSVKVIKKAADLFLRVDANSASCVFMCQPKAPDKLKRFRKH